MPEISERVECRDVWSWALSWLMTETLAVERRRMQREVVASIAQALSQVDAVQDLHELYQGDSRWCVELARLRFPKDWASLGVHATSAAAFGVRYVELVTGRPIDARQPLPRWISEWAVW